MSETKRPSRAYWVLPLISILVSVGYGMYTGRLGRTQPVDHREYVMAGTRLLRHGTLTSSLFTEDHDLRPSTLMPPGYVAIVATAYGLFGVESPVASFSLQAINILAIAGTVVLVFLTARRLGGERAAWLAGLIAAIHPALVHYTIYIWDTSLFTFITMLCVWIAGCWPTSRRSWHSWLLFGLWLGAVALFNPALTIAYPLLILWPASRVYGWRIGPLARSATLAVIGWLVAITPWTIRNYHHFGALSYIRGGFNIEAWLGFCPEADGKPSDAFNRRFPLKDPGEQQRVIELGEQEFIRDCGRQAIAAVKADPARAIRLIAKRTLDYWTGNAYSLRVWERGGRSLGHLAGVLFVSLEGLVLLGALAYSARRRQVWWLVGMLFAFSLVYCLTHVMLRYRAPMEPVMVLAIAILIAGSTRRECHESSSVPGFRSA